jgi:hypothetical protein
MDWLMRILHTHSATELTVDISTKLRVASFRFVEGAGDVRVLTVPLPALDRLYRDIAERLLADPELFGSAVES